MDFITEAAMEAQWLLEEAQREMERQKERERIQKIINTYVRLKSDAETAYYGAEATYNEAVNTLAKLFSKYEREISSSSGSISDEYDRVHCVFGKLFAEVKNNYYDMLNNTADAIARIDEKLEILQAEYDAV